MEDHGGDQDKGESSLSFPLLSGGKYRLVKDNS
jgi:hypothetical protein